MKHFTPRQNAQVYYSSEQSVPNSWSAFEYWDNFSRLSRHGVPVDMEKVGQLVERANGADAADAHRAMLGLHTAYWNGYSEFRNRKDEQLFDAAQHARSEQQHWANDFAGQIRFAAAALAEEFPGLFAKTYEQYFQPELQQPVEHHLNDGPSPR